jgi:hypothetical protein
MPSPVNIRNSVSERKRNITKFLFSSACRWDLVSFFSGRMLCFQHCDNEIKNGIMNFRPCLQPASHSMTWAGKANTWERRCFMDGDCALRSGTSQTSMSPRSTTNYTLDPPSRVGQHFVLNFVTITQYVQTLS